MSDTISVGHCWECGGPVQFIGQSCRHIDLWQARARPLIEALQTIAGSTSDSDPCRHLVDLARKALREVDL